MRPDPGAARRPLATEKEMGQLAKGLRQKRKDPGVPTGARGVHCRGCVWKSAEPEDRLLLGGPAAEPRQHVEAVVTAENVAAAKWTLRTFWASAK